NFFCNYCMSPTSVRPKGFMEENLFKHIADQLPGFSTRSVALHIDGEPTLHPKFIEFVEYLNAKGIRVGLLSNGTTLKDEYYHLDMDILTYISTSEEEFKKRSNLDFGRFNKKLSDYLNGWWNNDCKQRVTLKTYCAAEDWADHAKVAPKIEFVRHL